MRHIHLEDQLRIRFPGRTADFDEGVEIGMLAALMTLGQPSISRWISVTAVEQIRALATRLGYRVIVEPLDLEYSMVTLQSSSTRPQLRVVSSS